MSKHWLVEQLENRLQSLLPTSNSFLKAIIKQIQWIV